MGGTNPDMVVIDVLPVLHEYRYRCIWVDAEGVVQFADFREDELERVPTSPSSETKPIPAAAVIRGPHNPL
jgi:uncharacterized protein YodC (DUF2158 family)